MNKEKESILEKVHLSVLDLVPVTENSTPARSFENTVALAKKVEELGFTRIWISEHHNMQSVASSATAVLIGHVASNTRNIRVGSGGIMLPNHSPLIVAEQFGTLETLFPGRIDLGLGRAPGTDQRTASALRRGRTETVHDFPNDVQQLMTYLSPENRHAPVRSIPGEGCNIPLYLLGSSMFSAKLAGMMGLGYAFASHFAPAHLEEALRTYRESFAGSGDKKAPYTIACVNVIAGETDEEATFLATSQQQFALGILRNQRNPMPPPVKDMSSIWNPGEKAAITEMLKYTFVGSKETIEQQISEFALKTGVDEIMVVSHIFDPSRRLRSYEILSQLKQAPKDPFFDSKPPIE